MALLIFVILLFHSVHCIDNTCNRAISYPTVLNINPLSSSHVNVLLTLQNEDLSIFCATFNIDELTFSEELDCDSYANDILEFTFDTDITETRVNSISRTEGIDITRDSHSFIVKWSEMPNMTANVSIASENIESFTLDSKISNEYTTFVRLSDENEMYAIKFDSELDSNDYQIYTVQSNAYLNIESEVRHYDQYKYLQFIDAFDVCHKALLYEYSVIIEGGIYTLNLTLIDTADQIGIDQRNNFGYFWGYSSAFTVFDIWEDSVTLQRYGFVPSDFDKGIRSKGNERYNFWSSLMVYVLVVCYMCI